jgi:16S rRNA (cytidine1402-2'-O)-methyltransferase
LFVVATPIGNLEDITLRAIRVLKEVKLIAAEDTRKTRKLLSAYNIKTPATSYHEHNKLTKLEYILDVLEKDDVALVSDAGMPGISDPGYELIAAVIQRQKRVIPVPGPSVLVSSLVISGLPTDSFHYVGFLPRRPGDRARVLQNLSTQKSTLVLFESPHRLAALLQAIRDKLGDRQCAICRELTKVHEEVFRGSISAALEYFSAPRGEFTVVIAGKTNDPQPAVTEELEDSLRQLRSSGYTAKDALRQVTAATGLSRKEIYKTWLKQTKE